MADEILSKYSSQIKHLNLVPGSSGIFQIYAGDKLIFDKNATGRFPKPGEAEQLVRPLL